MSQRSTVLVLNVASRNAAVNKRYGAWSKRVGAVALFIQARGADFVCVQELYAVQRPALDKLLTGYERDAVRGGRVIYRRKASHITKVGGSFWTDLLPGTGTKYAVARKYAFRSGAVLNLANAHLSFETNLTGVKRRAYEVPAFVRWVRGKFPTGCDGYFGDFNAPYKSTTRKDDVGPIFAKRGLHDLADDVGAKPGPKGVHLLRGFAGVIRATAVTVHPNGFTDHPAVRFTISIPVPR